MKVGVSSKGSFRDADVDAAFGRCPFFVVADLERKCLEKLANPGTEAQSGAGPQTVQALKSHGIDVVLTGRVGPNAARALEAADIEVVQGIDGTVKRALEAFVTDRFGSFDWKQMAGKT